ncbi:hypothetical protein N3K66_003747 [Trichothecium roseum]|uniref:Uncharacterized protein n=1 Tax=Trichothecium roseum TaxID=47278 RepID=A0ACC0V623_9HYPO|nr:hypothetical protein N3K66_003747 [Trichothecium roseum]
MESRGSDSAAAMSASSIRPSSADEKASSPIMEYHHYRHHHGHDASHPTPAYPPSYDSPPSSDAGTGEVREQQQQDGQVLSEAYRKVDWTIMPLMFLCYLLQFLDKVIINYANIMGLQRDLSLHGDDFSWMATIFFVGYAVAELPQGYLLQRFPIARVLGINVILWGVVVCCTAAVQDFAGAAVLRAILGVLEAVVTPALIVITSQWYARDQATPRTGVWYCGLGAGQIIGGLISWAAQHGSAGGSFPSWRIMFVSVGAFNVGVGAAVVLFLPSTIRAARFLSEAEKQAIEASLARDRLAGGSGEERNVFRKEDLWEALCDLQVWLLFLNTVLIVIPSGIITTFSATLIHSFGYDAKASALLNMPSGVVSIAATIGGTYAIRERFPRWLGICALLVPTMAGAGLMSFAGSSKASALAGIYLINFDVAPLALIYALAGANAAGYTKRVATSALVSIAFSLANIIGPQTFRTADAPGYMPAKMTVFAVCGASIVVTVLLRLLYGARNGRKEAAAAAASDTCEEVDCDSMQAEVGQADSGEGCWTDRTNPGFRYVY